MVISNGVVPFSGLCTHFQCPVPVSKEGFMEGRWPGIFGKFPAFVVCGYKDCCKVIIDKVHVYVILLSIWSRPSKEEIHSEKDCFSHAAITNLQKNCTVGCAWLFMPLVCLKGCRWWWLPSSCWLSKSRIIVWWLLVRVVGCLNGSRVVDSRACANSGEPRHKSIVELPLL